MKSQMITFEQALAKGYTHFVEEEGEHIEKLSSINKHTIEMYKDKRYFIVDMNSPMHYKISADTIMELIADYVRDQDEVADENDFLAEQVEAHDYSELAKQLNEKFAKKNWYEDTLEEIVF